MSDPQAPVQEHQFKELEKFQMFTPAPGAEGRRSRLSFSSYRGNPRLTVFTGVPNDTGKGVIHAAMNPETFMIFLKLLEQIAKSNKEEKNKIDCDTLIKAADGARSQERTLSSSLVFGRDAEGVIWISVIAENRPKIKFEFQISDFHRLYKGDGSQFTKAEASSLQALAVIDALRRIFTAHASELKPPYQPNATGNTGYKKPGGQQKSSGFTDNSGTFEDLNF